MHVAVEGCVHGQLDLIYSKIREKEIADNIKVDLLLCCGDFQAIRNESDLEDLQCPPKYKAYHDFKDYYNGIKEAPVLTIFVGGNHEAPAFLKELYYGGWVAKNIYYMGHSGVVNVNGIRIAGLSGIYYHRDYTRGFFEQQPYDEHSKKSAYHVREYDVKKLQLIEEPIDIFLSHDWPRGIEHFGDTADLMRRKPFLTPDIQDRNLGNPHAWELLAKLKPRFWFAAHLHVKFEANVKHDFGNTYFLALDKPMPGRHYIEYLHVDPVQNIKHTNDEDVSICYDVEWLAIVALNAQKMPLNSFPSVVELNLNKPEEKDKNFIKRALMQETSEPHTVDGTALYPIPRPTSESIKEPAKQRTNLMTLLGLYDNDYFTAKRTARFKVKFK
ncbi:lariat-debranching enzyme, putative [Babesia bigemina]|uniref:Lariat-debranching enzyme, putative n=1 Tax=Babesia bigemina TaxID=5866 RepID=A0A061D8M4_BABBI|nr:lariat-debranching enzyme, putative [Babesia bigemina]CDR94100.1 lariat-debranching enzyme, putative [Babesia bigemina]|eukprot:XP_012766286.1 lariat-debranching enzyme, putative [Babesia bigemina]